MKPVVDQRLAVLFLGCNTFDILLTSLLFVSFHGGASYLLPISIPFIVANTFSLGLACGYLIMKTKRIQGAVLVHAAAGLFLFIAMLAIA